MVSRLNNFEIAKNSCMWLVNHPSRAGSGFVGALACVEGVRFVGSRLFRDRLQAVPEGPFISAWAVTAAVSAMKEGFRGNLLCAVFNYSIFRILT